MVEDAKALLRTKELTGAGALLDVEWPPRNEVHLMMGRPSRDIPGMELTEESDTSDEEDPRGNPPPYCSVGPRQRERRHDDDDQDQGRGNAGLRVPPAGVIGYGARSQLRSR